MFAHGSLARMHVFIGTIKTSTRQPSVPDRELKVYQIHTIIKTLTSILCQLCYWNILSCFYFLTGVPKFAQAKVL